MSNIQNEVKSAICELIKESGIKSGEILIMGCSTSEIIGSKIGTNSNPDTAKIVFEALYESAKESGIKKGDIYKALLED